MIEWLMTLLTIYNRIEKEYTRHTISVLLHVITMRLVQI